MERCEAHLQQYGFLSKVKLGNPNTEGAVDLNGKQGYVSDYDHWRIYKESFDKTLTQLKPNIPFVPDITNIGTRQSPKSTTKI